MDLSADIAASMKEATLEQAVRRILADLPSLLGYHTHDSRRSHSGYPDWTFVGARSVMFRELKTARGVVSPAQQLWLDRLERAGQDAGVWRPEALMSGRIARELAVLAGLPIAKEAS